MPLYEYRCQSCDHHFEILQRMGDGAEGLSCPRCGEDHLARQFSTFASSSSSSSAPSPSFSGAGGGCGAGGFT